MRRMVVGIALLVSSAAFLVSSAAFLVQAADDPALVPTKLPSKQQAELVKLLADYKVPVHPAGEKEKIVDRIFELGPPAVRQFQATVEKQLRPLVDRYRDHFFRQASVLSATKVRGVSLADGKKLRDAVLDLRDNNDLKKEDIVKAADPAMKQLAALLVVDREAVLESLPELGKEREKLGDLSQYWERCAEFQANLLPEDQRPKEKATFESYLVGEEELAARLAMPMPPTDRNVLYANEALAKHIDPEEAKTILACNLTRVMLGLRACVIDVKLCAAARDHSHDMETLKFFAHDSKVPGKKTPWDRAKNFGTSASAENIYSGRPDGKEANDGWFHSPGHFKNMLADHWRIGVGRSSGYFTEMFGGK